MAFFPFQVFAVDRRLGSHTQKIPTDQYLLATTAKLLV
jgi:hypothetical protein